MTLKSVQSLIKKYGIRPKKRLGQHFLIAQPTAKKIVCSLDIQSDDVVMEIGCGPGVMTELVAERASRVYAVDSDSSLINIAKAELAAYTNIVWICNDILQLNLDRTIPRTQGRRIKVIGNLPYNISTPTIFWMIENRARISRAIIMLQKEVALRIVAAPGGKDYGILSVLTQVSARCKKLFDVSAKHFIPPPDVTSSVIMMDFEGASHSIEDVDWFKSVVKGAFGKRRKTLRNALLGARDLKLSADQIDNALEASSIDGKRRPETLSIDEFVVLSETLRIYQ